MKRVLFIVPSLSNGGAEKVVSCISSGLANKGYNVSLLTFFHTSKEYEIDYKVRQICISDGFENDYIKIGGLKRIKLIRKIIKETNPDVIFPFLDHVCCYTFFSSVFSKYRKNIIFTENNNNKYSNKRNKFIKQCCQLFVKRILIQNDGQKQILSKMNKKKATIIANPINEKYFDYSKHFNNSCNTIISIGRLTNQKDYRLAINAFNKVSKKYSNLTYHIFGKGEDEEKIRKLIMELNLEDKVILEGFTSNHNDIYEKADIFLMTSKFEGLPNALAESLAVGIPCISSDCDFGPSDLIENENMGILVKEHTIDAFENAMIYMIENYEFYVSKSNEIKEIMKRKYSLDVIVEEWIKLIEG